VVAWAQACYTHVVRPPPMLSVPSAEYGGRLSASLLDELDENMAVAWAQACSRASLCAVRTRSATLHLGYNHQFWGCLGSCSSVERCSAGTRAEGETSRRHAQSYLAVLLCLQCYGDVIEKFCQITFWIKYFTFQISSQVNSMYYVCIFCTS